jgi:F-type H+-transporting ATPase subunit epsilon
VARTEFPVEVLTPEGQVFEGEVEMVSTRTTTGSIGILAHHQPLLGMLEPTELRLYTSESEYEPDSLDAGQLKDRLSTAERELEQAEEGSEEERRAQREKRRWEAFLRIAEGA